jgi:hypothetical protein
MTDSKLQVPTEIRNSAEKTIDQAEKAFEMFFGAAKNSVASIPSPTIEISKKILSLLQRRSGSIRAS